MITIYKNELKINLKSLLIWAVCVGGMGFACILLFSSMQADMESMSESFASMGAFSEAFGMSKLGIGTITGFYAAEVGTIHALGGAMFAAVTATVMLSKEEDGHTSEFLFSLPLSRTKIILAKYCSLLTLVTLFNLICVILYLIGFAALGETVPAEEFLLFHAMQLIMQVEIASICFCFSAFTKKNMLGTGLGIVLLLYAYDLIARVVPDLSDYKILSPFSYANASDILSGGELAGSALCIGILLLGVSIFAAFQIYNKRDLAS